MEFCQFFNDFLPVVNFVYWRISVYMSRPFPILNILLSANSDKSITYSIPIN